MGIATGLAIAGGVAIAAGAATSMYAGAQKAKAARRAQGTVEAGREYVEEQVNIPELSKKFLEYKQLEKQGELTPELEIAMQQVESELKSIAVDPEYKEKQLGALNALEEVYSEGGLSINDRAKLEQLKSEINQQEKGRREAILQNARARGVSGSGIELASQLISDQQATNRFAQGAFQTGADARKQALDAKIAAGNLAGNLRGQEFGEQKDIATAGDAINRFTTANNQDVQQRNVNRKNAATEFNTKEDQRIADTNVGIENRQQQENLSLEDQRKQQEFNNTVAKTGLWTNQNSAVAQAQQNTGNAQAGMWGGLGQTLTGAGTSMLTAGIGGMGAPAAAAPTATSALDKKQGGFDPYGNIG